jgi:alpha-D-xyloside xylohydrolase
VDVYVFAGPSMRQAVQRYNLFSGGGALPPRWGLGVWYRAKADYKQDAILSLADDFRTSEMPCEVIGLEPGWQTHAYSCTYVWSDKFPDPAAMVKQLADRHFRLNLWEHSFTNPASPIHQALIPNSGDYEVWGGLVPDFLLPATQRIFSDFHAREHVAIGVSGYKLDECDNSDFTGGWSFPEASKFPSGVDGEQMHCLFGRKYQDTIQGIFDERKQRTYGMVRSAQALAAPYPYVLYSDLYEHRDFIRGLVNSGFSGLLWTPELRDATSTEDLLRRLQSVIFSPMAIINAWYIRNPPWKQVNMDANNAGNFDANWKDIEASCRKFLQLRMRFIPYLHAAFVRYNQEGIPPFRSVAMDFPDDPRTWLSDQDYMVGEDLLVAPVVAGDKTRSVYLPEGTWLDFWTGKEFSGKLAIEFEVPLDRMLIFVKAGSIIPLATPTLHTEDPASWTLQIQKYGSGASSTTLYEDDGSFDPRLVQVDIEWDGKTNAGTLRTGTTGANTRYKVDQWIVVKGENG